jgi:hypothetical protein
LVILIKFFGNTNKVFASFERTPNIFVPEKMSAKSQNHMQLEMVQRKSKSMSLFVTTPNNSLKSNIEQFWGKWGNLMTFFLEQKDLVFFQNLQKLY